jgi:DNA-binding response OmpR family regulator
MSDTALVLVVDDVLTVTDYCEFVLSQAHYRVASAPDGLTGLEMAVDLAPDLILLDMMMPELDGLSFLDRLRSEHPAPPAVIAMSGFDAFEAEALSRGACGFIRKPMDSKDLLAAVEAALHGASLEPAALVKHAERAYARRKEVTESREALLARVDLEDQDLNARLSESVRWLGSHFGTALAFVNIQRGDKIRFQAAYGGEGELVEGGEVDASMTLCAHVTQAAAPLVLSDASLNAVFASHPAVKAGFRFYAGVPLKTKTHVVLGTLCLLDKVPRPIHGEDLAILETIADSIADRLEGLALGRPDGRGAFVLPGVFTREILHAVLIAELNRLRREGGGLELAIVDLGSSDHAAYSRCSEQVYATAGRRRVAVAEYATGGLAVLLGAASVENAERQMQAVIAGITACGLGVRGVGVAALAANPAPLVDARAIENMADEARMNAVRSGANQRVVSASQSSQVPYESPPVHS